MPKHAIDRRAKSLETAFFHRVDQQLIFQLQKHHREESDEDALTIATVSRIPRAAQIGARFDN